MGKITIEVKINTFGKMKHPNPIPQCCVLRGAGLVYFSYISLLCKGNFLDESGVCNM